MSTFSIKRLRAIVMACVVIVAGACASTASAGVSNDYPYHWTIYQNTVTTWNQYAPPAQEQINYAWTVDMAHSSRVSQNNCSNYNDYTSHDFDAHSYIEYIIGFRNGCFALRARSLYDTQYDRNGHLTIYW